MATSTLSTGLAELFARAIEAPAASMPPDVARFFLAVELTAADRQRLDELAARSRAGELSAEDQSDLDEYRRCGRLVEVLKLRARTALQGAR